MYYFYRLMLIRKKILAFATLLLVLAPLFFFTGYLVKQKMIQYQMQEQLEKTSLQTITVNKAEISWARKDKEVIINGELFDVKSYIVAGDKIILTGLYDAAENELKKEFANLIQHKKNDSAPLEQLILKFIFTAVINQSQQTEALACCQNKKTVYPLHNEAAIYQSAAVATPPPNI
jgi:hypothetical protein